MISPRSGTGEDRTAYSDETNKTSRRREELGRKLKKYQIGGVIRLDMDVAKRCAWIAFAYEVDETGLLFFCFKSIDNGEERVK